MLFKHKMKILGNNKFPQSGRFEVIWGIESDYSRY